MISVLGLTGPSGAGKTLACEYFSEKDIPCINADMVSREVTVPGSAGLAALVEQFSDIILSNDGSLNRKKLAGLVFSDKEKLKRLEDTVFPFIMDNIKAKLADLEKRYSHAVLDAPTLFESGADKLCHKTLAVSASLDRRKERIIKRDGLTEEQAVERLSAQKPDSFYKERADYFILNDGDADTFFARLDDISF